MSGSVASPCVSLCRIDARTGWCEGCWRSLDEIAAWSTLGDEDKRRVWALLPLRRAQAGVAAPAAAPPATTDLSPTSPAAPAAPKGPP